ncbi:hypothetical protein FVE85_9502 [Porphyridium purpureum]|uniref:Uncharacterized protein n=1 Tax=Porphyridium purpureum TaxID=35688 RepID=A0A5J4YL78_PORPP|nr:hypothetical protein FVE85_9502 [Porphyridium purpureum]|eukprot:POR4599..scf261_15
MTSRFRKGRRSGKVDGVVKVTRGRTTRGERSGDAVGDVGAPLAFTTEIAQRDAAVGTGMVKDEMDANVVAFVGVTGCPWSGSARRASVLGSGGRYAASFARGSRAGRSTARVSVVRHMGFQVVVPGATPEDYRRISNAKDFKEVQMIIAEVKERVDRARRARNGRSATRIKPDEDPTDSYFESMMKGIVDEEDDEFEEEDEEEQLSQEAHEKMLLEKESALRVAAKERQLERQREATAKEEYEARVRAAFAEARKQQELKQQMPQPIPEPVQHAEPKSESQPSPPQHKTGDVFKDSVGVSDLTGGRNVRATKGSVSGRIEREMTQRAEQNPQEYVDRDEVYEENVQHRDLGKPAGFFSRDSIRRINDADTSVEETYEIMRKEMSAYQDRRRAVDPNSHHRNVYDYFSGLSAPPPPAQPARDSAGQSARSAVPPPAPYQEAAVPRVPDSPISGSRNDVGLILAEVWSEMNAYQSELAALEAQHRLRLKQILDQALRE